MSDVRLEPARPRDSQAIALWSRDLIERGLGWRWRPKRVLAELRREDSLGVVARDDDGRVIGFALMRFGLERAHLMLFAVAPSHRRQGLGRALLDWLERASEVAGCFEITLEVRNSAASARAFYAAAGFRELALVPRYYDGREHAMRLVKHLSRWP